MRKGFDEDYVRALIDGINEDTAGELDIIGLIISDYMRVIEIYCRADDNHVIRYDLAFNSGYTIDQYIELAVNDIMKNHNIITYVRS